MNLVEKIQYYRSLSEEDIQMNLSQILLLDSNDISLLFLNVNSNCKKILLSHIDFFRSIINIPPNKHKKYLFELIDDEIRDYIFMSPFLLEMGENNLFYLRSYLEKISPEVMMKTISYPYLNQIIHYDVKDEIKKRFLVDDDISYWLEQEIDSFPKVLLFSIHNIYELFIFLKFHILVTVSSCEDGYLKLDDKVISYEYLKSVHRGHICKLLNMALLRNEKVTNNQLFLVILKLYMVFGFDNTKKILNDFFTFATEASIKRASDELFRDNRRSYRLQNQDQFYYHGIEEVFKEAISHDDVSYFIQFCGRDREYAIQFMDDVKHKLQNILEEDKNKEIFDIITSEIANRESYCHDRDTYQYQKYYQDIARRDSITLYELYCVFSSIDLIPNLSFDGKVIPDSTFIRVLLGNCKKDNDCLLRMVFNQEALGLNQELGCIVEHFDEIKDIISHSDHLSFYSILDIIDISKVFLYHLKPDELDITLETLSKIINSRKFCIVDDFNEIIKKVLKIHKLRKFRTTCSVPFISGEVDEVFYRVVYPYEESLLSCGVDADSCLKIGGPGEDLFLYCLLNRLGFIMYLNYGSKLYILPCTVNGNMININSIDPKIEDESVFQSIYSCIKSFSYRFIKEVPSISLVTVTDIHHKEFMKHSNSSVIDIKEFIPLNTDIYSDYNKKDVLNYVVAKRNEKSVPQYFYNSSRYFISRFKPYIFYSDCEYDKERIELLINQIAYSSIDFLDISDEEKVLQKEEFKNLNVDDYICLVGNMDWFIAIDKDYCILKYVLFYDERGVFEFQKYEKKIDELLKDKDKGYQLKRLLNLF